MEFSVLLWFLPIIPIVSYLAFFFSVKRGWPLALDLLLGAGSHPIAWVGVLILNQLSGREQAVAPILVALFTSFVLRVVVLIAGTSKKLQTSLSAQNWKKPSARYIFTAMMALPFLGMPVVMWWLGKVNARGLFIFMVPMAAIVFVAFLFERSQYKSGKWTW